MGINPTQPNYKSFTFAGTNSRQFGVYITGEGVFNAPERNVEMIEIPGRNGAYALDKGNFNNIEVTYPAGIFADTEADFAKAVSDLRNFLCSQSGYVRLEDDYNTGEYRMAIYKSGLEVTHDMLINGEFNLVFECKPQRWLTSGETAISITSGDTVTNPTLFKSSPLLEVIGNGSIGIGDQSISVLNATLDEQVLHNGYTTTGAFPTTVWFSLNLNLNAMQPGDTFIINGVTISEIYEMTAISDPARYIFDSVRLETPLPSGVSEISGSMIANNTYKYTWKFPAISFTYGTASSSTSVVVTPQYYFYDNNSGTIHADGTFQGYTFYADYDGDKKITFYINGVAHYSLPLSRGTANITRVLQIPQVIGTPSLSNLTKYIDCEIGECYAYQGGELITWNNAAVLPSELPILKSGPNTITFDNTITSFKVVPRWWKV